MEVLTQKELNIRFDEIAQRIKEGAIFIHPSDTIYGLSCSALNEQAVQKIRKMKNRPKSPLSIWVPSKKWISTNCSNSGKAQDWIKKLPGPYTLILPLRNKNQVAKNVTKDTIGIRLPDHWFSKIVEKLEFPIITTSANKKGEPFMTNIKNLDPDVEKHVEFMIYEGEKETRPSKLIHVEKKKILER